MHSKSFALCYIWGVCYFVSWVSRCLPHRETATLWPLTTTVIASKRLYRSKPVKQWLELEFASCFTGTTNNDYQSLIACLTCYMLNTNVNYLPCDTAVLTTFLAPCWVRLDCTRLKPQSCHYFLVINQKVTFYNYRPDIMYISLT